MRSTSSPGQDLAGAAATYTLLLAVGTLLPNTWLWGLNATRFIPAPLAVLAVALASGACFVLFSRSGTPSPEPPRPAPRTWFGLILPALVFLACLVLDDRVRFTGDFSLRVATTTAASFRGAFPQAFPGDELLHNTLPFVLDRLGLLPETVFHRLLGAVEAAVFAAIAQALPKAWGCRGHSGNLATAVLLGGGATLLFTGLPKATVELTLLLAAATLLSTQALVRGGSLMRLGLCTATALLVHRAGVLLLVIHVTTMIVALRSGRCSPALRRRWGMSLVLPALCFLALGGRVLSVVQSLDWPRLSPLATPLALNSWALRLADAASLLFYLVPLWIALPVALVRLRRHSFRGSDTPLIAAAVLLVPQIFLLRAPQGVFRDWDMFAPAGLAVSMLTARLVTRPERATAWPGRAAIAIWVLAIASVGPWLVLFHRPTDGLSRAESFVAEPPSRSTEEQAVTLDFLATRRFQLGQYREAADAAARYSEIAPTDRAWYRLGLWETFAGRHRRARDAYARKLRSDPTDAVAWLGYGGASLRLGDSAEAARSIAQLRSLSESPRDVATLRELLRNYPEIWPRDAMSTLPFAPSSP